jgi:hypothetical protein
MTSPPPQRTRFQELQGRLGSGLREQVLRSWRAASLTLLSLLIGFFAAQNVSGLLLARLPGGRPLVVLGLVVLVEVLVRLRSRFVRDQPPLGWVIVDNLRIGAVYAIVFEAFKLGT